MILREVARFLREQDYGIGFRELPVNPDSTSKADPPSDLSKNALKFWAARKYGAFAASIRSDPALMGPFSELAANELALFSHYLVIKLAAEDKPKVRKLGKNHPDRAAFAEVVRREKRHKMRFEKAIQDDLSYRGAKFPEEITRRICLKLSEAADDCRRIFFRPLTKTFDASERDRILSVCLGGKVGRIVTARENIVR